MALMEHGGNLKDEAGADFRNKAKIEVRIRIKVRIRNKSHTSMYYNLQVRCEG